MIAYLKGVIYRLSREEGRMVLLTASGVGYEVVLPAFVLQSIVQEGLKEGDELGLDIYYHVTDRQPRPVLVGFRTPREKSFFEQLIQVEGVGPAKAASALIFPPAAIAQAIESEDATVLRRMPGIGDRAAQKMIASLRGKVTEWAMFDDELPAFEPEPAAADGAGRARDEAIEILVNLGYRLAEARQSVDDAIRRDADLANDAQELIREVFRALTAQT